MGEHRTPEEISVVTQQRSEQEEKINTGRFDFAGAINPPPLAGTVHSTSMLP